MKAKAYLNGHPIDISNFDLKEEIDITSTDEKISIPFNQTITAKLSINWWNRMKLKLWIWKESFSTHNYTFTLRSKK